MIEAPIVAVAIPLIGDERHKNWAKVVHSVDPSKTSGWAFEGDFIAPGGVQDVAAGSVVLIYGERGSRANPQIEAQVLVVNPDATLSAGGSAKGKAWARTLRDEIESLLGIERPTHLEWVPELSVFSDQALIDELVRRGYRVSQEATG